MNGHLRLPTTIHWIILGLACNAALALPMLWALWPAVPLVFLGCAAALAWSDLCVLPVLAGRRRFDPRRMLEEVGWIGAAFLLAIIAVFLASLVLSALLAFLPSLHDYTSVGFALILQFLGGWLVVWLSGIFMRAVYGYEPRRWSALGGGTAAVLLGQSEASTSLTFPLAGVLLAGLPWLVVTALPPGPRNQH